MAASGLHISISAETLATIGGFPVSNSIATSLVASGLLIAFALWVRSRLNTNSSAKPSGVQNVAEWIVDALYNLVFSITNDHRKARQFFPLVATFFLWIVLNNWLGLIPGVGTINILKEENVSENETEIVMVPQAYAANQPSVQTYQDPELGETVVVEGADHAEADDHTVAVPLIRPGTADLNTTLALAIITMFSVQFFGVSHLGLGYFSKFFNFSNPIMFFVGILELISEVGKVVSFAFRLFGNIFAGEVLLTVIKYLIPIILPIPFLGLEIFVGFIQGLVFALLSLVFYNLATQGHEHD